MPHKQHTETLKTHKCIQKKLIKKTVIAIYYLPLPSGKSSCKKSPFAENTWIRESATTISPPGPTVTDEIKLKHPFWLPFFPT